MGKPQAAGKEVVGKKPSSKSSSGPVKHKLAGKTGKKKVGKKPFGKNNNEKKTKDDRKTSPLKRGNKENKDGPANKKNKRLEKEEGKKMKKGTSEMSIQLMALYEKLRVKNVTKAERKDLIEKVLEIVQGKEVEVIYKHDTVRVLEMCVKFGDQSQKEKLFKIFQENCSLLLTSKYAKFLVEKFVDHGTKEQRNKVVESFYGKIGKLLRNKYAANVLDKIYNKYATAVQRKKMLEEFFGPEYTMNKVLTGESIEDILADDTHKKRSAILSHMKDSLTALCQKEVVKHSIVHKALQMFFQHAHAQQRTDLVEILKESVVEILHTKYGAKVAMSCFWYASVKDRKSMLKSLKTFVVKVCKEEYGHLVLLALFDCIDDTVLVRKALFPELMSNLQEIVDDGWGRKVILYLLKPRCKSYFLPEIVSLLTEGDGNSTSKKEASVKQEELRNAILPSLLKVLATHVKQIIKNKSAAIVLLAAIEVSPDSPQLEQLFKDIANLLSAKKDAEEENVVRDECGHYVVKNIIKLDKSRRQKKEKMFFSTILCDVMPHGYYADWALHNRSAFVLVSLLESEIEDVVSRVKSEMTFSTEAENVTSSKGRELLLKLLST